MVEGRELRRCAFSGDAFESDQVPDGLRRGECREDFDLGGCAAESDAFDE